MSATPLSSSALYNLVAQTLGPNATGSITAAQLDAVLSAIIASYPNTVDGYTAYSSLGTVTSGLWNGTPIGLPYGGTNANLTATPGGVVYSTNSQLQITPNTTTAGLPLLSGNLSAPTWGQASFPASVTANSVLYASTDNVVSGLPSANGGVLNTSTSGVPSITPTPFLGVNGGTGGAITLRGGTSGSVTLSVASVAGASTGFQLPAANGAAGGILTLSAPGVTTWSGASYPSTAAAGQMIAALTANTITATYAPVLGANGVSGGSLTLAGATSGSVAISVPAVAGPTTFRLPGSNGAAGALLTTDGSGLTSWTTTVYPNTVAVNRLLYASTANTITGLATANNGVVATNSSGVPSVTPAPTLGVNGGTPGSITLNGPTSGSATLGVVSSISAAITFNLPGTNGAANQVLATDGAGNTFWTGTTANGDPGSLYIAGSVL